MSRRKRGNREDDNGFAEWGGYMAAKKSKLQEQFMIDAAKESSDGKSKIFEGVAIFVNGYSVPSADELKLLMMKHGGIYHHYYRSEKTTHIIATNLPDTKVKRLKTMNIVKPDWIVDSIAAGHLLDFRQYLLYSNCSKTQPKLMFQAITEKGNSIDRNLANVDKIESSDEMEEITDLFEGKEDQSVKNLDVKNVLQNKAEVKVEGNETKRPNTKSNLDQIKTASETGFLNEFYSNSRLHHISTMGATFKQYVNNLRANNSGNFPGVEKLKALKSNIVSSSFEEQVQTDSVIMHIDMDCFFASVGLRNRPDLKGFPVAVTHAKAGGGSNNSRAGVNRKAEFELYKARREEKSKNRVQNTVVNEETKPWSDWVEAIDESNSMSEIASCNYEARKYGLKNGMFLGQALKLCPNLKTIPYDFEGYKEVSYCLYDTVASFTLDIEAISCDEMFVDCTKLLNSTAVSPLQFATLLRTEIKEKTGCPCSAGFGGNRLQARLATKRAKPDGQFFMEPSAVQSFMADIKVSDLPGVGRATSYKLSSMGVKTCQDLQKLTLSKLQGEFGVKSGESLYKHCRGEDLRKLVFGQVRKSVSAEVNYGIRFQNSNEAETFLKELCKEVHSRLQETNMRTKFITLKLMIKAKDAPVETAKFLGHGVCDNISRSSSLQVPTSDVELITSEVLSLNRQIKAEPQDLRGTGIQLSRLESSKPNITTKVNAIDKFLLPSSSKALEPKRDQNKNEEKQDVKEQKSSTSISNFFTVKKHPPKQDNVKSKGNKLKTAEIDKEVLDALPDDIRKEIMQEYGLTTQDMCKAKTTVNVEEGPSTSRKVKEPDKAICDLNYSQIDLDILNELPIEIKQEVVSSIRPRKHEDLSNDKEMKPLTGRNNKTDECVGEDDSPKLDHSLTLSEIRTLIKAWTGSEDSPQPCDTSMMADFLEGLVVARQLENLDICVSCLYRCIEKKTSSTWEEAYFSIISRVQSTMLDIYGHAD